MVLFIRIDDMSILLFSILDQLTSMTSDPHATMTIPFCFMGLVGIPAVFRHSRFLSSERS